MPKSRRRPVSTDKRFRRAEPVTDTGPKERWQHSGRVLEFTEKAGIAAVRATEEHIVDLLRLRGVIDDNQRAAALRFKLDYQRAGLAQHITGGYTPIRRGEDYFRERERSDAEEAAYQRWRNALRKLGIRFSNAVISVACHDLLPTPRELPALQKGLEILVKWYGIE